MNKFLLLSMIAIVLVMGCTSQQPAAPAGEMPSGSMMENTKVIDMDSFVVFEAGKPKPQYSVKNVTVNKGDKIIVHVRTINGTHNFNIDEFNVQSETPAGNITTIEFVADKAGEFVYYCSKPGHRQNGHWGTLTVLDAGSIESGAMMEGNTAIAGAMEENARMEDAMAEAMMEKNETAEGMMPASEIQLARNYYRYDYGAYQRALAEKKIIFLDFHANWCPVCKAEHPGIVGGFNNLSGDSVIGFQVHYNDNETQDFDTEIIRKYQVAYQHTKIILGSDGSVKKKTQQTFDKDRLIAELNAAMQA